MEENDGVSVLKLRRSHHSSPSPSSESSSSGSNLELVSLKSSAATASYTSLKDLLASSPTSSILSPTSATSSSSAASSVSEISIPIRNRLVKQAAWAYLQPAVSPCPSSSPRCVRFSGESLRAILGGFRKLVGDTVTRVCDWLVISQVRCLF
ncbi:hypothetical protein Cgig2_016336 [Carnegiea gigantea]|uniref:Uncharacterized protein n=1 Tax=Carnegiea gigantea TaxID=171969 RepID=A0A9Q1Q7P2_9CARY|nr:hypothetical protein Cgig2_016336 [Carnegiea gigantea]